MEEASAMDGKNEMAADVVAVVRKFRREGPSCENPFTDAVRSSSNNNIRGDFECLSILR